MTYERPSGAYTGASGLANRTKYQDDSSATPKRAVSSSKVDGDINYLVDAVNTLDTELSSVNAATNATAGTVAAADKITFVDVNDSNALKTTTAQAIADLYSGFTMPAGMGPLPWPTDTAPSGWLLCYGQAVSRTTYSDLFSVIGTTFGAGDSSTTFNLPDMRGRTIFGKDNMGGSAASRLTSGVSGVDGTTIGAVGGDQRTQQHTHTATVTDPGHLHTVNDVSSAGAVDGTWFYGDRGTGATVTTNSTNSNTTGITVANADYGSGNSQNIPPAVVSNWVIKT
jgi:microcystin-dependent protein